MKAARIFYRLVKSGATLTAINSDLLVVPTQPLTDKQRQAVTDHKPGLLDLVDWYADDTEIIRNLTETQFNSLAEDYRSKRDWYRSACR